jgi:hypothetical protein
MEVVDLGIVPHIGFEHVDSNKCFTISTISTNAGPVAFVGVP